MARPKNETEEDLARELAMAEALCSHYGLTCQKLHGAHFPCDFAIFRGEELYAWLECKHRFKVYDPWHISHSKILRLSAWDRWHPVLIAFACGDRIWWIEAQKLPPLKLRILWAGNDRGQQGDKEPMIEIPHSVMNIIETTTEETDG